MSNWHCQYFPPKGKANWDTTSVETWNLINFEDKVKETIGQTTHWGKILVFSPSNFIIIIIIIITIIMTTTTRKHWKRRTKRTTAGRPSVLSSLRGDPVLCSGTGGCSSYLSILVMFERGPVAPEAFFLSCLTCLTSEDALVEVNNSLWVTYLLSVSIDFSDLTPIKVIWGPKKRNGAIACNVLPVVMF